MYQIYSKKDNTLQSSQSFDHYDDATFALQFYDNCYVDSLIFDGWEARRGISLNWDNVLIGEEALD